MEPTWPIPRNKGWPHTGARASPSIQSKPTALPRDDCSIRLSYCYTIDFIPRHKRTSTPVLLTNIKYAPSCLIMNLRSPEQYNPPKSASLSRRRRTHSDRRLLVQSTVIPNSRIVRTRRAATLPRHHLVDHRTPEPQTPLSDWDLSHTLQGSISDGRNVQSAHEAKLQTYNLPLRQQVQSLEIASQGPTSDYTADSISISAQDSRFQSERDLGSVHPPSPFVTSSCNLQLERSVTLEQPHARYLDPHDMRYGPINYFTGRPLTFCSTLGYMMTSSHYGMGHYGSTPSSYSPINPPQHASAEQRSSTPGSYSSSYASSPALASDGYFRRQESRAALAPYQPPQSLARSSFQQGPPSDVMRRDSTPLTSSSHNYTYSAPINSSLSSQAPGVSAYPP